MTKEPRGRLKEHIDLARKLKIDMDFLIEGASRALARRVSSWSFKKQIEFLREAHRDDRHVADLLGMHIREAQRRKE